jgi:hypothetical protein
MLRMETVFREIEALKREGVIDDYAVAGAVAAQFYVEAFRTADVDFLVHFPQAGLLVPLGPIHAWLRARGYEIRPDGSFIIDGWPVQFLPVSDELSSEALREANYLPFGDLSVRVVRAEHLAAEALKVGRRKDFQRVEMLLLYEEFDRDLFESLVSRFGLDANLKKVESLIGE